MAYTHYTPLSNAYEVSCRARIERDTLSLRNSPLFWVPRFTTVN